MSLDSAVGTATTAKTELDAIGIVNGGIDVLHLMGAVDARLRRKRLWHVFLAEEGTPAFRIKYEGAQRDLCLGMTTTLLSKVTHRPILCISGVPLGEW